MDTLRIILEGLGTGFVMSLMLGTVFFALLRTSLVYGYKTGLAIATGVVVCDVIFIALALFSSSFAGFLENHSHTVSVCGGLMLIVLGAFMFFKKAPAEKPLIVSAKQLELHQVAYFFGKGFLLNAVNPVNFFFWLGISTGLTVKFHYTIAQQIIFFIASLVAIWFTEFLIAYFATKVKILATPKALLWVNRISGIAFIIVGIRLLFS